MDKESNVVPIREENDNIRYIVNEETREIAINLRSKSGEIAFYDDGGVSVLDNNDGFGIHLDQPKGDLKKLVIAWLLLVSPGDVRNEEEIELLKARITELEGEKMKPLSELMDKKAVLVQQILELYARLRAAVPGLEGMKVIAFAIKVAEKSLEEVEAQIKRLEV